MNQQFVIIFLTGSEKQKSYANFSELILKRTSMVL